MIILLSRTGSRLAAIALAGSFLALSAVPARAAGGFLDFQNPLFKFGSATATVSVSGPQSTTVTASTGIFAANYYRGKTSASGTPNSYLSVCNDVFQFLNDPTQFTKEDAIVSTTNTNKGKIAWLVDEFLNRDIAFGGTTATGLFGVKTAAAGGSVADRSAGFQLAIWDLWYTGAGYTISASSSAAVLTARTWFTGIASTKAGYSATTATWLHDEAQDQLRTDAVPEPAFYQLSALLGFGGLGMWRMRRQKPRST
jgi:hypothetical protein